MPLEPLLARLEDLQRLGFAELAHDDLLEAPLERRIAFDPSLVLVARRRADDAEVAAHERGLEHVGRVHRRADRRALPDQIVQLVDEQDHVARRGRFGDDAANSLLVLAAIRRAGQQRDVVERQQPHRLRNTMRHALGRDALREPFGDRRLADARGPDERRIVLAVPQQDVDDARDLVIAAAHGLEAAGARVGGQVARESRQRAAGGFVSQVFADHWRKLV